MSQFKIPAWLVATIILFAFILVAGLLFMVLEKLPPSASPSALEARFSVPIRFLKEMAACHPGPGHHKAWWDRVEANAGLFSDPVILGASIYVCHESMRTVSMTVKAFDAPESTVLESWINDLSPSSAFPDVGRPSLVHRHAGGRRLVKYRNVFLDASGKRRGYQLVLDLERLEATCESSENGAHTSGAAR
jgi:hypothetical protein